MSLKILQKTFGGEVLFLNIPWTGNKEAEMQIIINILIRSINCNYIAFIEFQKHRVMA